MFRVFRFLGAAGITSALTPLLIAGVSGSAMAQITGQPALGQPNQGVTNGGVSNGGVSNGGVSNGGVSNSGVNNGQLNQSPQPGAVPSGLNGGVNGGMNGSMNPAMVSPIAASSASNATYILGPGDQISLSVIGYPEFTGTLALLSDGTVTLPLTGRVRASGMTADQLGGLLTQQLREYLVDPVVSVGLVTMRPVVVTVSGEVHRPGPIQLSSLTSTNGSPLGGTTDAQVGERPALPTLSSAVLLAGGVTRDADIRQVIVRRPVAGGRVETLSLNLWNAITSDAGAADIGLRDGDSIFIPRLSSEEIDRRTVASSSLAPNTVRVKVVGEVVAPGEISVPPASSISSAVAIAGGPTSDAQLSNVSLVRQGPNGQIQQEEVDLSNLVDSYQIQDGDVVVVAKRGYLSVVDGIGRVFNPLNIFRLLGF